MLGLAVAAFLTGWALRSLRPVPPWVLPVLDRWVVAVALPALVLSKMSRADLGADLVVPVVAAWTSMAACALLVTLVATRSRWPRSVHGALLLVGVLGNTSFLGLAAVAGLLGSDRLEEAIAYDQLGTFLALALWGSYVAGRFGAAEPGWRPVLVRIVRFPPFVALVAAVLLGVVGLPEVVRSLLDVPAWTTSPVAMFALGLRFTVAGEGVDVRAGAVALAVKMLVVPAGVLVAAFLLGDPHEAQWQVSVLQSAAPPMVSAGIVAVGAGLEPALASWVVGTGTLLALVALPAWSLVV